VIFYGTCQLVAPGEVQKDQAVSFQRQVGHSEPPDDLEMQTGTSSPCIDWLVHFVMLPAASFAANQSECSMRSMWRKLPHEELRLMQSQGEAVQPPSSSAAQLQLFHLTTESYIMSAKNPTKALEAAAIGHHQGNPNALRCQPPDLQRESSNEFSQILSTVCHPTCCAGCTIGPAPGSSRQKLFPAEPYSSGTSKCHQCLDIVSNSVTHENRMR
jgi:hypothetical protein